MVSNSSICLTDCSMSQRRSSSPSGTKAQKSRKSMSSSLDSTDRMKRASETSLCAEKTDRGRNRMKMERSNHPKVEPFLDTIDNETQSPINAQQSSSPELPEKCQEGPDVDDKDDELADVLTRHIYLAEHQMQRMQSVLKRAEERLSVKDQEISRLKRKIKEWEAKSKNQDVISKNAMQKKKSEIENSAYLYKRCLGLEHKIFEMEKFLGDYGLVWIGDSKSDTGKEQNKASNDFIKNCYAQLTANIEELNISVGKDEVQVELNQDGGGATFKVRNEMASTFDDCKETPSCMCLRFYKNGMVIEDGKLRPYSDPKTVSFIRDILDGYFPSELQKSYPNGVPFQVEDHRKETYLLGARDFPGQGYRLGKQALIGKRASTSTVKSTASVQSSKSPFIAIENNKKHGYNFKTGMPSSERQVPPSARASNQTICPSSRSVELLDLRSQILASHNNHCSHSHLQSHVNAELGLGNRIERRTSAAKTTEYHMSVREKSIGSRGSGTDSVAPSSRNEKTSQHRSIDRSPGCSSSRMDKSLTGIKSRPRSVSLNSARYPIRAGSRMSSPAGHEGTVKHFYHGTSGTCTKPRITRSATLDRKNEMPIVREINASSGKPGELRLKVRSMNGSTVFLVHLSADDSVGQLYQLLDKALVRGRHRHYKIIVSGYERKRLDQFGIPLREYGISRDSVLHLVND